MQIPDINFPNDLPVSQKVEDIKKQISRNQVTIICGETGSGKTTQLPKICLALGRGQKKLIFLKNQTMLFKGHQSLLRILE